MNKFTHILFPVDFSERCEASIPFVEEMARRENARLTLLSVAHPYYAGGVAGAPVIDTQQMLSATKAELDEFAGKFSYKPESVIAEIGDPATAIVDFVRTHKVDLVMMPSHGYGPFRQLLLGSVTAKVLHDVDCAVWTTAHRPEVPAQDHVEPHMIVCAVDANEQGATEIIRRAAELSRELEAKLRFVHVVPGIEAWPERQMDLEFEEEIRANAKRSIEEMESAAGVDAPVCVPVGSVADAVSEEAVRHGADLLIIGRGTLQGTLGRLRTHAYGIIRTAPCPVLSI